MEMARKPLIQSRHKSSTAAARPPKCSAQAKGSHQVMMTALNQSGERGI